MNRAAEIGFEIQRRAILLMAADIQAAKIKKHDQNSRYQKGGNEEEKQAFHG